MIAFGPVPSRRLGSSLGINHIPPKHCPYSCVYCQVGRTDHLGVTPQTFFAVDEVIRAVEQKIELASQQNQKIDFLTFVPDGEPTLDENLEKEIDALLPFGYPIAVITNSALLSHPTIRKALRKADWVSVKVDTVVEEQWRIINRPHKLLSLREILTGILAFAREYAGELVTESMFINGINDQVDSINRLGDFLNEVAPFKVYLSIPIRPPAESWVMPPSQEVLQQIMLHFSRNVPMTDLLFDAETDQFVSTGNLVEDILSITSVHPIRENPLKEMVTQAGAEWQIVEELVASNQLLCIPYRDDTFYCSSYNVRSCSSHSS